MALLSIQTEGDHQRQISNEKRFSKILRMQIIELRDLYCALEVLQNSLFVAVEVLRGPLSRTVASIGLTPG